MSAFRRGQRVKPSEEYKTSFPVWYAENKDNVRGGKIVETEQSLAKVLWDGITKPELVHVDYLAEEVLV